MSSGEEQSIQKEDFPAFELSEQGLVNAVSLAITRNAAALRNSDRLTSKPPLYPGAFNRISEQVESDRLELHHIINVLNLIAPRTDGAYSWSGYISKQATARVEDDTPRIRLP